MKSPINLYFDSNNQKNLDILSKCPTLYKQPTTENEHTHADVIDPPTVPNAAIFHTSFLMANNHIHNAYAAYKRVVLNLKYQRDVLIMKDGGTVSMDWFEFGNHKFQDDAPTILILHGLTGGSYEGYVQHFANHAFKSKGFRSVVFNYRGCAGNPVTADKTYCATFLDDLKEVIQVLKSKISNSTKLFAIGFSLGSAILINYLKNVGEDTPFIAHCSVSNPFDMDKTGVNLRSTYINQKFYNHQLAMNLVNLFIEKWGHRLDHFASHEQLLACQTIKDVDDAITAKVHGYRDADHYYQEGSSSNHIDYIKKPTLFINSIDDPISPKCGIPYQKIQSNPNTILATTNYGGHLGFLYHMRHNSESWAELSIVEYFSTFL